MSIKRLKTSPLYNYHSASSFHNYMLNDPILDFLKKRGLKTTLKEGSFGNFIINMGKSFEKEIVEKIKKKLGKKDKFITIANCIDDIYSEDKYQDTITALKNNTAVVYQGVLHGNEDFRTFGCPDLIIRSDIINKLFNENINIGNYHYVIVDIKFNTLKLKSDGKFLLNEARTPAYKTQLYIYNKLLGLAMNSDEPKYFFILGRGWKFSQNGENYNCNDPFDKLGYIDKDEIDTEKIYKCIKWLDDLREYSHTWTLTPPSVPELYPNMSNKYDDCNIHKIKLSEEIGEITRLWNCGYKQRIMAHNNGVYSMYDVNLTTDIMGLPKYSSRTELISKMLKFNQGLIYKDKKIMPSVVNNVYSWHSKRKIEGFLDFETISSVISGNDIVFMIGIGLSIQTTNSDTTSNLWKYCNITVNKLNDENELQIFNLMYDVIDNISKTYKVNIDDINFYHWGSIEKTIIEKINVKYPDQEWLRLKLVDLNKVMKDEHILIKGVYGFGIKEVGRGLINHGLIDYDAWDDSIENGLDAMIKAHNYYNGNGDVEIINVLKKYNQVDVKIMLKIINCFREHMSISSDS